MQNKPRRGLQPCTRDAPLQPVNSTSLTERLRAVPVEFHDRSLVSHTNQNGPLASGRKGGHGQIQLPTRLRTHKRAAISG
jgi:hypothetical protein